MTGRTLRLGSRKSPMAIVQSELVAGLITERTGRRVEIVGVTTLGDVSRAQLTQIGGTGVFVSALREALLGGEVDLAVHSLKDLPAGAAQGIALAAVPPRDDPRGCARGAGRRQARRPARRARGSGPGSPRRVGQLLALRGDLRVRADPWECRHPARQVTDGELDGVVLACAGLARIGYAGAITQVFELDEMLPARPGRAGRRVPRRRPRTVRAARGGQRRGQHGRRGRRTQLCSRPSRPAAARRSADTRRAPGSC